MSYQTSHDIGRKPFFPDAKRGYWAQPTDFIYACLSLGIKMDIFLPLWFYFSEMGVIAIAPYILSLALYVVPILVIQSFMGQFSSSGFLSVFRVAPLFKGISYVSLVINFVVLIYYSLFAAIPLFFFFNSFRPTLPWSCEAFPTQNASGTNIEYQICGSTINLIEAEMDANDTINKEDYPNNVSGQYYNKLQIPSVIYFRSMFKNFGGFHVESPEFSLSWQLVICSFCVWAIIALVSHKCCNAEKLGRLLRYLMWAIWLMMIICFVRFLFLKGATISLLDYLLPDITYVSYSIPTIPIVSLTAFGPGWGTIIALSSFNKFKTNISSYSWIICIGQVLLFIFFGLILYIVEQNLAEYTGADFNNIDFQWIMYLSSASVIANMSLANMWSIIFYAMLTLAALLVMIPHFFALMVSIFDEFESLRSQKTAIIMGTIGTLALFSIYFCSNEGITFSMVLAVDTGITQAALNLILLFVVLWVYGRVRFQRDFEFMMNRPFATWKVYMMRFVAPICLLLTLLFALVMAFFMHILASPYMHLISIVFVVLPWIFIPAYSIVSLLQATGTCFTRLKRCCRPTDWYPVDGDDRQRYEEALGNMDITHQLHEVSLNEAPTG